MNPEYGTEIVLRILLLTELSAVCNKSKFGRNAFFGGTKEPGELTGRELYDEAKALTEAEGSEWWNSRKRIKGYIMIFEYEELKEYIKEDFEQFYKMGFYEKQIFPAVLNEYRYGEDFGLVENICIHVFLVLIYAKKNWDCHEIIEELNQLMNGKVENEIKVELGTEYMKFITDFNNARNNK